MDNSIIILITGGIIFAAFVINVAIKDYYWKRTRKDIYLCVDYFIRNMHEQSFYHPKKHIHYNEYAQLYYRLKKERYKWYFNDKKRESITYFLNIFERLDHFIGAIASYMSEDHYFAHSEFLKCKELASFKELESFFTHDFIKIVNKYEMCSYTQQEDYIKKLNSDLSVIPQTHNITFVKEELDKNKDFFDTVMKYPLDKQQRESIVKLEDNALVISSAGSGKTSTMVGKIKYLVERKNMSPEKILPLTYGKNASDELTERLSYGTKGLKCFTFHGYAKHIVEEITGKKLDICNKYLMLQCFYYEASANPYFKKNINLFLTEKNSLTKSEHDYHSGEEYMRDRALYGIQAPFLDMDNRIIFTKSEEEKKICTFLSMNNISFRYEAPFQYDTRTEYRRQYKPDFTIWFMSGGRWVYLILEHFGIDCNGNVPIWFGDGKSGGYAAANAEYQSGIVWKRNICNRYHVPLIETTSAMFHDGTVYTNLKRQLETYGVPMRQLTEEEKFDKLVVRNKRMEDSLLQLIGTFVTLLKSNRSDFDKVYETVKKENPNNQPFIDRSRFMLYDIFKPVYDNYQLSLLKNKQVDYTDLILQATDYCENGKYRPEFDYILVDEFQDISIDRFNLLQALRKKDPMTKLYCVGDDWQSIFRFSGSDLTLFSDFEDHFGYTEKCKIETTYRFGNPLVKRSSEFILKNDRQVPKEIKPVNNCVKTDLTLHEFDEEENSQFNLVHNIVASIPLGESIMLLARYHADADFIPNINIKEKDEKGNVTLVNICSRDIPFVTVHAAKGLEADHAILVNCSQDGNGFPSKISDDPILGYVLSKPETYPFAEERRLFYVAITRAKKHSYVLYKNTCPSPFIADLEKENKRDNIMICPMCKNGTLREMKSGENSYNKWSFYACTNKVAGCRYTWFVNYIDESEILTQYNNLN